MVGVGGEPVGEELRQSGEFGRINGIDAGAGHGREPRGSAGSLAQEAANTPSSAVIPPDLTDRAGPHHR